MKMLFLLPAALALLALSACHKIKDFWDDHLPDDARNYQIVKWERRLNIIPGDDVGAVAKFTYNRYNNPVSVVFDTAYGETGENKTNWYFTYDNQNKLSGCYLYFGPDTTTYYLVMKFQYDNSGKIISDSSYHQAQGAPATEPNPIDNYYNVNYYTYDSYGRIIKVLRHDKFPEEMGDLIWEYAYDSNGNLTIYNGPYDNKVNFLRTNKIWQFINRDLYLRHDFFG